MFLGSTEPGFRTPMTLTDWEALPKEQGALNPVSKEFISRIFGA
ncbi:hypothetical protein ACFXG4_07070 [Nocardia sp. NPDC059246]